MINESAVVSAIEKANKMDIAEQAKFMDMVHLEQPNLLGSVLVLRSFGLDMNDIGLVLHILMVLLLTLEEVGIKIEQISEKQQEKEFEILSHSVNFADGMSEELQVRSIEQYANNHKEPILFGYVLSVLRHGDIVARTDEKSKYIMMSALNLVNCISNAKRSITSRST